MRKRRNIIKSDVLDAYKALRAEGRVPSGVDIREKTLGGSHTTIYKFLREIRAEEAAAEQAGLPTYEKTAGARPVQMPAVQAESAMQFLKALWDSARKDAQAEFASHEAEFAQSLVQLEQQLTAKQQENDRLIHDIDQMEESQKEMEAEIERLKDALSRVQGEIGATHSQSLQHEKDTKALVEVYNKENEVLKTELSRTRQKETENASSLGELQTLKDQFSLREREFKERIQTVENQIASLRIEKNELLERAVKAESLLTLKAPVKAPAQ